jgi:hypothetical protein
MTSEAVDPERRKKRPFSTDPTFLEEYEPEETWAPRFGITRRTSARYRNHPNGLPFILWGGIIYIHKKGGGEYIASRVKRRNPRRRRGSTRNSGEAAAAS